MRILTMCLATAMAATALLAQGPRGPRDGSRAPSFDEVKEALSLTDTQLATIQQNNQASREQMRAVFEEAKEKREALKTEVENENPNPTIVGQLMLDAKASHEKAEAIREATREQNVATLDAQQQAALNALAEGDRSPALRQAGMLNLLEGPDGRRGKRGGHRGPGRGGFGGGPRG